MEWLWAILQVEGPERLSEEESSRLADWLAEQPPPWPQDLLPTSSEDASRVLDWTMALLVGDRPDRAAAPARIALAYWDTLVSPGRRGALALVLAAHAALRASSRLAPQGSEEAEALVARTRTLDAESILDAGELFMPLYRFALFLSELRRDGDAETALRLALKLLDRSAGVPPLAHAVVREELAVILLARNADGEAERLVRAAIEIRAEGDAEAREGRWRPWLSLGTVLWRRREWVSAGEALRAAEQAARSAFGERSDEAAACAAHRARFRRDQLHAREHGRLFGWALREATGTPFERAVASLLAVAETVRSLADADALWAEAARLKVCAGAIDEALDLSDRMLSAPRHSWSGAAVYADGARVLFAMDDRILAADVLRRGFARAAQIKVFERCDARAAERDLMECIGEHVGVLDSAAFATWLMEILPADAHNIVREHELDRAVGRRDLAAAREMFAGWDWTRGAPDAWSMCAMGCLAAEQGDCELARRLVGALQAGSDAYLAVEILQAAGWAEEVEMALATLQPGRPRANGLAIVARRAAEQGDRALFDRMAQRAVAELSPDDLDLSMALHDVARGARTCLSADEAAAWASAHLPEEAREPFRSVLAGPAPAPEPLPGLAAAMTAGDWKTALAALRSVGDAYSDLLNAESLATAAAADGRADVALAALRFAAYRLGGRFAEEGHVVHEERETRMTTARRLGDAAFRLLPPVSRLTLAEEAFVRASALDDMPSAGALVVAAAMSCRTPSPGVRYTPSR